MEGILILKIDAAIQKPTNKPLDYKNFNLCKLVIDYKIVIIKKFTYSSCSIINISINTHEIN